MNAGRIKQAHVTKLVSLHQACRQLVIQTHYSRKVHNGPSRNQHTQASSFDGAVREFDFLFARARLGTFVQEAPVLGNQYLEDAILKSYLKRHVPQEVNLRCLYNYKLIFNENRCVHNENILHKYF